MTLVARRRVFPKSRRKAFMHAKRAPGLRAARYFDHELRRAMRQSWQPVCALKSRQTAAAGEFVRKPLFGCRETRKDANPRDLDLPSFSLATTKSDDDVDKSATTTSTQRRRKAGRPTGCQQRAAEDSDPDFSADGLPASSRRYRRPQPAHRLERRRLIATRERKKGPSSRSDAGIARSSERWAVPRGVLLLAGAVTAREATRADAFIHIISVTGQDSPPSPSPRTIFRARDRRNLREPSGFHFFFYNKHASSRLL
ncbi:hypothetical protein GTR04_4444 [Trichophyton interdigitale]|nr:hypothetical protein GY631_5018 [Trichophyton interdigitale]KAG5218999.1 hypothetical protein GY632_4996 [Trichophyton interdigitale]KAG8208159.1 hypothetical protein GTR04_4444 [Trichophyton interdigitale]